MRLNPSLLKKTCEHSTGVLADRRRDLARRLASCSRPSNGGRTMDLFHASASSEGSARELSDLRDASHSHQSARVAGKSSGRGNGADQATSLG
jgi:hypothetical protein